MGDGADDAERSAFFDEMDASGEVNKIFKKEIFKKMGTTMTGKVVGIKNDEIKNGQNKGKPYYKITVEDAEGEPILFHAWNYGVIEGIELGKNAEIDFTATADGKWRHINKAILVRDVNDDPWDSPAKNAIETPSPAGIEITAPVNRDLSIIRQSALKGAIEYHAGDDSDIEAIIATAQRFVEFDLSGE